MPDCPECMGGISIYRNPAHGSLDLILRMEKTFLSLHDFKNPVIITWNSAQINRYNHLGPFCNGRFQLIVIHFQGVFLNVYKY